MDVSGDGETVVVIDDGTGEDLEPVSSTEGEDSEEEEVVQAEEVEAYDTNVIPTGEFEEEDDDEEDVNLPESTFAASVAETVANVVGASTQQSEEIKVKEWTDYSQISTESGPAITRKGARITYKSVK